MNERVSNALRLSCSGLLALGLDIFVGEYLCPILDYSAMYGAVWSILPHFDASLADIVDLEGEPLESIAAHWVQNQQLGVHVDGNFPNYSMPIPIPCAL